MIAGDMALGDIEPHKLPHHQELEVRSALALARGDAAAAFRLADRRCRIRPLPQCHSHVLRADALFRLGDRAAAVTDLVTALGIAPDDIAANRRLMSWGDAEQRAVAARRLVESEHDMRGLYHAVNALRRSGQSAIARIELHDDLIEGWATWKKGDDLNVIVRGTEPQEFPLDVDPEHALARDVFVATSFALGTPASHGVRTVSIRNGDETIAHLQIARPARPRGDPRAGRTNPSSAVTVIMPVYADPAATAACLDSLLGQLRGGNRVIIVDDASPDSRIRQLLDRLPTRRDLRTLRNETNLGFAGAVNRALSEVSSGDVILLNADTIVPNGFIERLQGVAHSAGDIGTVTPLSSNGEFTSFPVPFRSNELPDPVAIARLDRVAARVNGGRTVELPSGIGFCLYIRRDCLDAVGGELSESYRRGYYEDVDFCLRARRSGFRSVCATSVYIGHAGSRSFGQDKRALVVRNLELIEARFPAYRSECADFLRADPLKLARQEIERADLGARPAGPVLVSLADEVADVAQSRARRLLAKGEKAVLILTVEPRHDGAVVRLRDAANGAPQSLEFTLPHASYPTELVKCLRQAKLTRVELLDLGRLPQKLLTALLGFHVPHDVVIAHAELGLERPSLRRVVARATRLLAMDREAQAAASSWKLRRNPVCIDEATRSHLSFDEAGGCDHLGLIPVRRDAREQAFMRDIIMELKQYRPALKVTVLGATVDDAALIDAGALSVTGQVGSEELDALVRHYRVDGVVLPLTSPLFGHPMIAAARRLALPLACLDWVDEHRVIDPSLASRSVVKRLLSSIEQRAPMPGIVKA
jgi:GT2 family glycosyltransferase